MAVVIEVASSVLLELLFLVTFNVVSFEFAVTVAVFSFVSLIILFLVVMLIFEAMCFSEVVLIVDEVVVTDECSCCT